MINGRKTSLKKSILLFGLALVAGIGVASFSFGTGEKQASAAEPGPKHWSDVLRKDSLGFLEAGKRDLRARIINFEPGAETPFHAHDVPGIRYVLEGATTIYQEDGTSKTYEAGSTFFAGPVGNTPMPPHKAKNNGKVNLKILAVELFPEGYKKKKKKASAAEPGPKRWSDVLRKDSLGFLEAGKHDLKMRIFNWEYGGETPYHTHDVPGARYVLEGEITIFEEDGTSKTYKSGGTYFAGPKIGNNPMPKHKAKITGKGKYRVLIVELIPEGHKKEKK